MYFVRIFIESTKCIFHTDELIHTFKLSGKNQTGNHISLRIYVHTATHCLKDLLDRHEIQWREFDFFFPFIHIVKQFKIFGDHVSINNRIRSLIGP